MKTYKEIYDLINTKIYDSNIIDEYKFYSDNKEFIIRNNYKKLIDLAKETIVNYENEIEELTIVNAFLDNTPLKRWIGDHKFNLFIDNIDMLESISDFNKESDTNLTIINFSKSLIKAEKYLNKIINKYKNEAVNDEETYEDYIDFDYLLSKTFWYWNGDMYKCIYNKKTLMKALKEIYSELESNDLFI